MSLLTMAQTTDSPLRIGVSGVLVVQILEAAIRSAKTVRPKVLFPYHYGQTDVKGIPSQLKDDGIDVRIRHYE